MILQLRNSAILLIVWLSFNACQNQETVFADPSSAKQPYSTITAENSGPDVTASPDPLVAWRWEDPRATDELEVYTLKPVNITTDQPDSFEGLASIEDGKGPILVKGTGDLMIDFGQVNAAWLEFDSEDFNGRVEMSISEYREPAILNAGAQHRIKTLEPVRYGNTYRLELNDKLYEGVRYGWIHVRSQDAPWHIDKIRLVCQIKPTNYNGSFQSNNADLNRIWYTGAYGVKLNLLEDFFGAILMERSDRFSWTGDAYTSQAASLVAFGNYDFVLTNLHHTAEQDNGIFSYSMYWIQSLMDYYQYTGDTATLNQYIENARFKLDRAYKHYGTDPTLSFYGWDERLGAGFENSSCRESQNAYKMLCIDSWLDFAWMMESVGRTKLAAVYEDYAKEKIEELRMNPKWYMDFGIHAASDAINAGFTTEEEQKAMYELVFTDRLNRISYSPFNQYFIICALARMGRFDEAMETINDCWGGQLKYGATTFFEVFRPSWNQALEPNAAPPNNQCGYTSLCHPWGGGVVHWLTEEVLGVKPVKPGFLEFDFKPHPGSGINQLEGEVPTPAGNIQVSYNIGEGDFKIEIPEGLKGDIWIPETKRSIIEITMDGKLVYNLDLKENGWSETIREYGEYICFQNVEEGSHSFHVIYEGERPVYGGSAMVYPTGEVVVDTESSGNWGGKYGSDGYLLCANQNAGDTIVDLRSLPPYVKEISYSMQLGMQWIADTDDPRAPSAGPGNEFPRNAGAIYTQDPLATLQTMTVDIQLLQGVQHQIALYFVDWDDAGRRLAVEMFDLENKRLIAPVQVVSDYADGKYLVFQFDGPVRFRINHVRGPNATLSGIFFDTP